MTSSASAPADRCRIGVDNYSYHRRLGEVRAGESPSTAPPMTWASTISAASAAGAEAVSLQTCYMSLDDAELGLLREDPTRLRLAWGHPAGLEFGRSAAPEADARRWIELAHALGHDQMRIVVGHHTVAQDADRRSDLRDAIPAVARLAEFAESRNMTLAIENHTDFTASQLLALLQAVQSSRLRVCFDFANAIRVGDDLATAADLLAGYISMAHVKDVRRTSPDDPSGPPSTCLGAGELPVAAVVDSLMDIEDIWLLVELGHLGPDDVDEDAMVGQGVAWLKERAIRRTA